MAAEYSADGTLLSIDSDTLFPIKGERIDSIGERTGKAEYVKVFAWKYGLNSMEPVCSAVTYICEDIPHSDAD